MCKLQNYSSFSTASVLSCFIFTLEGAIVLTVCFDNIGDMLYNIYARKNAYNSRHDERGKRKKTGQESEFFTLGIFIFLS